MEIIARYSDIKSTLTVCVKNTDLQC